MWERRGGGAFHKQRGSIVMMFLNFPGILLAGLFHQIFVFVFKKKKKKNSRIFRLSVFGTEPDVALCEKYDSYIPIPRLHPRTANTEGQHILNTPLHSL